MLLTRRFSLPPQQQQRRLQLLVSLRRRKFVSTTWTTFSSITAVDSTFMGEERASQTTHAHWTFVLCAECARNMHIPSHHRLDQTWCFSLSMDFKRIDGHVLPIIRLLVPIWSGAMFLPFKEYMDMMQESDQRHQPLLLRRRLLPLPSKPPLQVLARQTRLPSMSTALITL